MASPYTRDELISLYVTVMSRTYPEKNVTREVADAAVKNIAADGSVTFADAGEANMDPVTLTFIAAGLSVVAGVLKDAIAAGAAKAWDAWTMKPAAEVVKKLDTGDPEDRRMIVVIFVEMQQNQVVEVDRIVHRPATRP
ncbi:MAG TPA: hypothetical protein VMG10_22920 [Gemmataceae bacterium]|nr:hypothetical protein [Gemmataceae bacterium]